MKPIELKQEYIRLRAEGKSYSSIAKELHVAKSTCTKWEQELANEIDDLKRAELTELYESYSMSKEARIRTLGGILDRIDQAIASVDLSTADPAKLLDLRLKYMEALKGESIAPKMPVGSKLVGAGDIVDAYVDLLNRTRSGDVTTEQAQRESMILASLLKAYDVAEIKLKVDMLEAVVGSREQ